MSGKEAKAVVPKLRFPEFRDAGAWEVKRLGGYLVGKPEYGVNAPAVPFQENLPAYLRITDISEEGKIVKSNRVSVDLRAKREQYLSVGDIVLARTGASVGKSYKYRSKDGKLVFAGFLIRIKSNPEKLNSEFLFQYLYTGRYWRWVEFSSARSGQPGINGAEYASMLLPIPPELSEQQKIAHCLSSLDEVIGLQAKKVQALKQHKKGLMQQLFPAEGETTPRLRFPEFREAGAWEVKRLGEVADVVAAGDLNVDDYSTERTDKYIFPIYSNSVAKKGLYGFCAAPKYKENSVTVTARGTLGVAFHRNCNFAAIGRL
uniref:restriction endonuclease subunit S n=1 Tax=Thiolapillus sp. TaxID=2017437 RepID=UPI003AF6519A